jgi:putative polyhydroxyalkanoate system protein
MKEPTLSHISIKRNHNTSVTEAKKVANKVAARLEKDYELQSRWDGDVLIFSRSGVNGTLAVAATHFQIDVKLGFLMAAFKGPIQGAIEQNLDKMIKPPAPTAPAKKSSKT